MSEKNDFLAGVLVGATVGAVLGILFAPRSGQETRALIRDRANQLAEEIRDRATDTGNQLKDQIQGQFDAIRSRLSRGGDEHPADGMQENAAS